MLENLPDVEKMRHTKPLVAILPKHGYPTGYRNASLAENLIPQARVLRTIKNEISSNL